MARIGSISQIYTADESTLTKTGNQFSAKALGIDTGELTDDSVTSAKINDGTIVAADLSAALKRQLPFLPIPLRGDLGEDNSIAVVSSTVVVSTDNTSASVRVNTLASGVWTSSIKATGIGQAVVAITVCKADPTKLIAWGTTASAYSDDSGQTWTVANADFANVTTIFAMSFPTTSLVVAVGNSSSGNAQWLCTDFATGGSLNWGQASTGSGTNTQAVDMLSAIVGLMNVNGTIWSTVDGDNWVTTTHTGAGTVNCHIKTITATSAVISLWQSGIGYYNNTAVVPITGGAGTAYKVSNAVKATNGYYYCIVFPEGAITDKGSVELFESQDDCFSFVSKGIIGAVDNKYTTGLLYGDVIQELSENVLVIWINNFKRTLDVS